MWKRVIAICGALIFLATTGYVASAAVTGGDKVAATSEPAGPIGAPLLNRQPQASASYWTADRLAAARPMEHVRRGPAGQSSGTSGLDFTRSRITPQAANRQAPYKAVGKLYFTVPGSGDFQCSASIIGKRLIVTAAHCMYGGRGLKKVKVSWPPTPR